MTDLWNPHVESSEKLGQHRWAIERTIASLFSYHRLAIRYERKANHFCAFLVLGATLTCFKRLAKLAALLYGPNGTDVTLG